MGIQRLSDDYTLANAVRLSRLKIGNEADDKAVFILLPKLQFRVAWSCNVTVDLKALSCRRLWHCDGTVT